MGKDKRGVNRGACRRCNTCTEYESDLRPGSSHECTYCGCRPIHHQSLTSSTKRDQGYGRSDCYGIPPTFIGKHRERIHSAEWNYHEAHISDINHQRAMHMGHHGRSAASSSSQQFHGPFPHVQSREHCFDQYQSHGRYLPQRSQDWHMGRPPPKVYQQFSQRRQEYHDHPVTPHQQVHGDGLKNAEQYCHPRQHDAHGSCNLQRSRPATSLPQELPNRTEGTELHNFQGEPYGSHHLQRGNNNSLPTGKVSQMMGDVEQSCQQVKNGGEKVQQLQKKLKKLEEDQNFVKRELDYILRMQIPTAMDSSIQVHATQQTLVGVKYTTERVHFLQQQLKKLAEEQMSVNMEVQRIISMEMLGNQTQRITLTEELPSKGNFDVQSQSSSDQRITGGSIEIEKNVIEPKSESPQKQNPKDLHVGQKAPTSQQATAGRRQVKNKPRRHQQTSAEDDNADTDRDDRSGKEGENLIKPDLEPPRQAANGESRETLAGQQRDGKTGAKTLEPSTQTVSTPGDESSEDDRNLRLGKEMKTLIKPEVETSLKQSSLGQDREALEGQEQCHDLMEGLKASCGIESSQPVTTTENDNSDADADRDGRPDTCKESDVKDQMNPELQSPPWQSPMSQSEVESAPGTLTEHDPRVEPKPLQGTKQLQSTHVKTTDEAGNTDGDRDDRSGKEGENLSVIKPDLEPLLIMSGETVVQEGTCVISDVNTASSETKPSQETASWERRNLGRLSFTSSPGGSVPSESEHHSMLEKDSASYISQDPRLHLSVSAGDSEMSSGEYFSASSSEMVVLVPHMIDGQGATHKDWGTSHGPAFSACTSKTSQEQESSAFCSEISTGQEISDEQDTAVTNSAMSREHDELNPIEETSRSTRQSAHISNVHVSAGQNTPVTTLDIQIHMPIGQNAPVSSGDRLGEENVSVPHDKPITGQNAPASSNTLDLRDVHSIAQNPSAASDETSREQSVPSHGIPTGHNVPVSSPDMSRGENVPGSTDTTVKKQTAQVSSSVTPRGLHLPVFSLDTCGNPTVSDPNHKMPCELDLSEEEKREAALPSNLDKSKEDVVASTMEKSAISPEERNLRKSKKEVMGTSPDKCKEIGVRLCPDQEYSTLNPTLLGEKEGKYDTVEQQTSKLRQPRLKWMDQYHIFHPRVHGKNIQVESNGMTARRNHCYSDGICFSQREVEVGCKVHLKIIESKEFKGSMRFGFTSNDPDKINVESLPAHSYPYLPQTQKGFWIKPLHDTLAQQGNVITYMVDSSGDVFYSINGEDKGLFFSGVDVSGCLWAVFDIHGSTMAIQFADDETVREVVNRNVHKGDLVKLHVDSVETLQLLHEGRGGVSEDLQKAIGETGIVIRIDDDEFVHVYFKNHKRLWSINPAALIKVGATEPSALIMEGDLVMIRTDKDRMRDLLKGHGEWVDKMESTLGKSGRVTKITDQGHLCVKVDGKVWRYNPEAVKKILPSGEQSGICDKGLHYWTKGVAKLCTKCGECTSQGSKCKLKDSPFRSPGSPCGCRDKRGGCADCGLCRSCAGENDDEQDDHDDTKRRLLHLLEQQPGRGEGSHVREKASHGIAEGDHVRVTMNQKTMPVIHRQQGLEWHDGMLEVVGMEGKVTKVTAKCVAVQFPNQARWYLAPGCLRRIAVRGRGAVSCQKGDHVRVINDAGALKKLQSQTCGFKRNMEATLGKTGCVIYCKDGKVMVDVIGRTWWFSPAVLSYTRPRERYTHIKGGDYVKVDVDAETFKNSQVCHGGYVDDMEKLLEQVGVVHHIDIDGDAVVYYSDGTRWCINAMSLGKVAPEECASVDVSAVLEVGDWVKVESDKEKIKVVQEGTDSVRWQVGYYDAAGKVGQVRSTYPFNEVILVQVDSRGYPLNRTLLSRASRADLKEVFGSGDITSQGVTRGDLVKIAVDFNKLRMLQDGHGGFVDKMDELIGHIGSVSFIDHDGDVYVRFSPRRFCFNPCALTKVSPQDDTFHIGDLLLIEPNQQRFRNLQKPSKHGGFSQNMLLACGKTGRLLNVHDHDRLRVKVIGKTMVLNPQLVTRKGNPGLGTGDWKSATICASGKHDWSTGRCLVCVTCGECTHYGNLCPARDKPGRFPGSICGCGNGHAGCDDCGTCRRCAGELQTREEVDDEDHDHEFGRQGAVKKLDVEEHQSTSSDKASGHTETSAVLRKMGQALELMTQRKHDDQESLEAANIKSTLQNDFLVAFEKYMDKSTKKLMGDHLANIDGAEVFSAQYVKFATSEDIQGRCHGTSIQSQCIALLQEVLIHCTDSSFEFCRALGRCPIITMFLKDLMALHKEAQSETTWPTIRSLLTILYNCARLPENQEHFPGYDVPEVLKPYLRNKDERIRVTAFAFLSLIVQKDNLHLIRLHADIAELIMSLLNKTLDNPEHTASHGGSHFTALQMVTILTGLVQNDENKQVFVKHGVVDKLIQLMESGDEEEKECAILCIHKLAYNDHISTIMKETTRVEEVLIALRNDTGVLTAVRMVAEMALKILQRGPPEVATDMVSRKSVGPESISTINHSDLSIIKNVIGGGGFGKVYRGYHKRWMMQVAVKKLKPIPEEQSLRLSKALMKEAKFMHRARNAYRFIVPLYGVCVEEQFTALVMDFMENGSVGDLMLYNKQVPWALKWRILHETILGMNFLHSLEIIHCDLKMHNVLLNEDFHAKISDFGLSEYKQIASGGKDKKRGICGTLTHIPPEHFEQPSLKPGEKFDVYSFGVLIWEILTGRKPFEGVPNSARIQLAVMMGQRPDTKLIPKKGPNELPFFNTLMEESWHQNPAKRPTFRILGKRVGTVIQRTNLQVAEAILAVKAAQAKEKENASQDLKGREEPAAAGALVTE